MGPKKKSSKKPKKTPVRHKKGLPGKRGSVQLREIGHYQSFERLIPKNYFAQLVKELMSERCEPMRMQAKAVEYLMQAAQNYLLAVFYDQSSQDIFLYHRRNLSYLW